MEGHHHEQAMAVAEPGDSTRSARAAWQGDAFYHPVRDVLARAMSAVVAAALVAWSAFLVAWAAWVTGWGA